MPALPSARFHTTVAQLRQLPREDVPEVAFIGRSNAGKSSAINVLCQRRRLAFSSNTPGRTQALNYYAVGREDQPPEGFLVDMPGYGYARAPGDVRRTWELLAGRYLKDRAQMCGAVLMIDIRRLFTELDRQLVAWLPPTLPLLVLLTKSDKFGTAQQTAARRAALATLAEAELARPGSTTVQLFSSQTRKGVAEARAIIEGWFAESAPAPQTPPIHSSEEDPNDD